MDARTRRSKRGRAEANGSVAGPKTKDRERNGKGGEGERENRKERRQDSNKKKSLHHCAYPPRAALGPSINHHHLLTLDSTATAGTTKSSAKSLQSHPNLIPV